MVNITETTQKCSRCGKPFQSIVTQIKGRPLYCKPCITLMGTLSQMERKLLAEGFSIEQEDEKIVRQMNELLAKESSGIFERDEELLTALAQRMLQDEKRRKKILKQILTLQKKKR